MLRAGRADDAPVEALLELGERATAVPPPSLLEAFEDFFSALPDEVEQRVECSCNLASFLQQQ